MYQKSVHFYQRQQCRAKSAQTFDTDFISNSKPYEVHPCFSHFNRIKYCPEFLPKNLPDIVLQEAQLKITYCHPQKLLIGLSVLAWFWPRIVGFDPKHAQKFTQDFLVLLNCHPDFRPASSCPSFFDPCMQMHTKVSGLRHTCRPRILRGNYSPVPPEEMAFRKCIAADGSAH